MSSRPILTSTLWQVASQAVMAALSIITTKFVAIGLSMELAGNYNSAYGYLQIFGILADFGLYAVAVREVSKARIQEKVLGALIVLRCIILALSLISALAIVWLVPMWRDTPLPLGVTIASFVPFFTLLAGIVRTVFQVRYRMGYVFVAEVFQRIITVSLIGFFVLLGVRGSNDLRDYHLFLFIGGIGAFVLFLLSLTYGSTLMKIRPTFDAQLLQSLFAKALPYGLAFLCIAAYRQFDVTLIALLRPDYEIQNAYYGFVQRAMDMAYLLPTFLLNSTLPALSEHETGNEDTSLLLGKTFIIILTIGVIAFLFSVLWSRPLMQLLTTERYLATATQPGSDTALRLLSISMFCNAILLYSFYILLAAHRWKKLLAIMLLGVIVALSMNLLLIPSLGFIGASITSIVVHGLLAALLLPQAQQAARMSVSTSLQRRFLLFSVLLACGLVLATPLLTGSIATAVALALAGGYALLLAEAAGLRKALMA